MNVEVHSNNNCDLDDVTVENFVPWRIGSEEHLGITRCSILDTTLDPPPYALSLASRPSRPESYRSTISATGPCEF